jgi:hypothetical protein
VTGNVTITDNTAATLVDLRSLGTVGEELRGVGRVSA